MRYNYSATKAAAILVTVGSSCERSVAFSRPILLYHGVHPATSSPAVGLALSASRTFVAVRSGSGGRSGQTSATCMAAVAVPPATVGQRELYSDLCQKLEEIKGLSSIESLLSWDEQVMMPPGGAASRADQKTALAAIVHEKRVELGDVLRKFEEPSSLDLAEQEAAVVRDALRDYNHSVRKSQDLAAREAHVEARAYAAWMEVGQGGWGDIAPVMQEMFDIQREVAEVTRPELGSAYSGCVDQFERGVTLERLKEVSEVLKTELVPLFRAVQQKVEEEQSSGHVMDLYPMALCPGGVQWGQEGQAALCREIAKRLGFDVSKGRLDVSAVPPTGGTSINGFTVGTGPSDVRISTCYSEDWVEGIRATVHEVGHALYRQSRLGREAEDLPVPRTLGVGVHESLAFIWEKMVLLSLPFWEFAAPLVRERFPHTRGISVETFHRIFNGVPPWFRRADVREITDPLDMIHRFEIEQGLIDGSISIDDVPEVWCAKMRDVFGVNLPQDKDGCLRDSHWAEGLIGYFPCYALGAVMACQFFEAAKRAIPDLDESIANGNFEPLKSWLETELATENWQAMLPQQGSKAARQNPAIWLHLEIWIWRPLEAYNPTNIQSGGLVLLMLRVILQDGDPVKFNSQGVRQGVSV